MVLLHVIKNLYRNKMNQVVLTEIKDTNEEEEPNNNENRRLVT